VSTKVNVKIKICGITRLEDALLAAELGAWAVGFILEPSSPRAISHERASELARALPKALVKVGVVVNPDPAALAPGALDRFQFHGEEPAALCARSPLPWFKVVRSDAEIESYGSAEFLMVDAASGSARGGTGTVADWSFARRVAARAPTLLAGGLTPENVAEAIARVSPAGIDASSGLESTPGKKDPEKLRRFFAAVRGAAA
jgi:phosphoribosylanthranilate isomerase